MRKVQLWSAPEMGLGLIFVPVFELGFKVKILFIIKLKGGKKILADVIEKQESNLSFLSTS